MSQTAEETITQLRELYRAWKKVALIENMRSAYEAFFATDPAPVVEEPVQLGAIAATWLTAPGARSDRTLLYFHGGGFRIGSAKSHRGLIARLSASGDCRVLAPEYRMHPEHTFPAAHDDAFAAYRWAIDHVDPAHLALGGDSAGGNLTLATMIRARREGLPLPRCGILLSPFLDLTATRASYETVGDRDPFNPRVAVVGLAKLYAGTTPLSDPRISPLLDDVSGLPPLLVQVGGRETLLDDSRDLVTAIHAAGGSAELTVFPELFHVFHQTADRFEPAARAVEALGAFVRDHLTRDGAFYR